MQLQRRWITVGVVATLVSSTFGASLAVGFSPLVTGLLVLASFGGGTLFARGVNLLYGMALVEAKKKPDLTLPELVGRARELGRSFASLAAPIRDAQLRRRVEHIGERLVAMAAVIERRPDLVDNLGELRTFVQEYLPRGLRLVERYIELARDPDAAASTQMATVERTLNQIADQVKAIHARLVSHELAEFADANLSLQTELELDRPSVRRPTQSRELN
jgi:hypothetical protein